MFSDFWSENAALFERLMEIYSNPPILYYGFKTQQTKMHISTANLYCDRSCIMKIDLLMTSPEYTRARVYDKCVL